MEKKIYEKIVSKKEFSKLPKKDVERAFSFFDSDEYIDEEKIKLTRELLGKVFWNFRSTKLLSPKNKDEEWILRKHISTRERLPYYGEIYLKIFKDFKKGSLIDLGCGANGFSYKYFPVRVDYVGVEAVGQLVDLTNDYFKKNKIDGKVWHMSLFDIKKIKEVIARTKKPRIVFLFKVLDSLEMLERDYSKRLLKEIIGLVDKVVVSFATESLIKRQKFYAKRKWLVEFINENFKVLDDFEKGGERYLLFNKK